MYTICLILGTKDFISIVKDGNYFQHACLTVPGY
jgi:hypothetical protein